MEFVLNAMSEAEIAAELNRSQGRKSEWKSVLAEILASEGCDITKAFGIRLAFPGRKNASVVAGLRKAAKDAKHDTLTIRVTPDTDDSVNITNSVKVAASDSK